MLPPRRTPSGLETSISRGPYRLHERIDWSCTLETEDLRFGCSGFPSTLVDDMSWRGLDYLRLHYPELVFEFVKGKKPAGRDYAVSVKGGHIVADWRTA